MSLGLEDDVKRYFNSLRPKPKDGLFIWPNLSSDSDYSMAGAYKYTNGIPGPRAGMLYPSVFAALSRGLCNDLQDPRELYHWSTNILPFQDREHGWFMNQLRRHDPKIDSERKWRQLTEHTLIALTYLGVKPLFELSFLKKYHDPDYMTKWLDSLDWDNPWKMSNWVLEVAMMLQYERDVMRLPGGQPGLDAWFDWHDKHQCPNTGFWGNDTSSIYGRISPYGGPYNALYGAYHQYLVYYYEGRKINYHEIIVDTVLALQYPNGSFKEDGGNGACEDIDASDVLVNMALLSDYRRDDIKDALNLQLPSIFDHQGPDGGFRYENDKSHTFVWLEVFNEGPGTKRIPDGRIVRAHKHTTVPPNITTAFATWFRFLSLASMSRVIEDPRIQGDWRFANCPGFQFDVRSRL